MSHALCIMAGFLASRALVDDDPARGVFAFLGATACLIAAGVVSVKYGQ